jgi:tRNA modification GTPase
MLSLGIGRRWGQGVANDRDTAVMEANTIFAVASGAGYAAIAVMRISGPASRRLLAALCGHVPPPRRASLRRLRDGEAALLDQAMVVWLPRPGSYTGEDSAELFLHGGRAVLDGVAEALVRLGARPAEPGEFTRRAFLNDKMDLTEAEAVHDLVAAETAAQRRQALRQLDGALGTIYRGWAGRLRVLLAQQEALIDFPDEDLPPEVEAAVLEELAALGSEVAAHLDDKRRGERLREGLVFAVTGRPNVGKSSLVNALAEREIAIVSSTPGTTRDALETRVVLGGVPVTLVDTAGLRDSTDAIEAEGVRRARARAAEADLVLVVTEPLSPWTPSSSDDQLHVVNKLDLGGAASAGAIGVSALTGEGLDTLRAQLGSVAQSLTGTTGPPPLTQARHRAALQEAAARLADARITDLPELRAEDLRLALRALGRITGSVGVEDILDTLFARFCIGK